MPLFLERGEGGNNVQISVYFLDIYKIKLKKRFIAKEIK